MRRKHSRDHLTPEGAMSPRSRLQPWQGRARALLLRLRHDAAFRRTALQLAAVAFCVLLLVLVLVSAALVLYPDIPGRVFRSVHPWAPVSPCTTVVPVVGSTLAWMCCRDSLYTELPDLTRSGATGECADRILSSTPVPLVLERGEYHANWEISSARSRAAGMQAAPSMPAGADAYPEHADLPSSFGPFARCAVVGSAGRLLHTTHGEDIDAHDAVFRFNFAPTLGFEPYVGNRTDFRFFGATNIVTMVKDLPSYLELHLEEDSIALLANEFLKGPDWPTMKRVDRFVSRFAHKRDTYVLSWRFVSWLTCYMRERYGGVAAPSSGLQGLVLAATMCQSIDVYGFGFFKPEHCFHYFDTFPTGYGPNGDCNEQYRLMVSEAKASSTMHRFDDELAEMQRLADTTPCINFVM